MKPTDPIRNVPSTAVRRVLESRRRRIGAVVAAAVTLTGLAGCGGSSSPGASGTSTPPSGSVTSSGSPTTSASSTSSSTSSSSSSSTSSATSPGCRAQPAWTTSAQSLTGAISAGLIGPVRVGRHDCYDRLVLSVSAPQTVGVTARYVDVVHADPSDRPLPVAGGAVIQLTVQAAPRTGGTATGAIPAQVGAYVYAASALHSWPSLRAVRLAGNFESVTTFAVGVAARLPFRLFSFVDAASGQRLVVLDVAHAA